MVSIVEAAIRMLVVALFVGGGLRLLRVRNVLAQKAAWGLVLAAAIAMPALMRLNFLPILAPIHLPKQFLNRVQLPAMVVPVASSQVNLESQPPTSSVVLAESRNAISGPYSAPRISQSEFTSAASAQNFQAVPNLSLQDYFFKEIRSLEAASTGLKIEAAALALYLVVAAALLLRVIAGGVACMRLWRGGRPILLSPGSGFSLRLRESGAVSSPVTLGSGVLLPEEWVEWDQEKLRIVLAHEDSHVRQGDFYLQMLAGVHTALFWFSPLGWWLKRKLSDLGEAISDRAGLEMAVSPVSYAQILLEFAASPRPTLIGVAMARNANVSQRIERFLNESSFRQAFAGGRRRIYAAVVLVAAALFAGTTLLRVEAQSEPPASPAPTAVPNPALAPTTVPEPPAASSIEPAAAPEAPSRPALSDMARPAAPPPPAGVSVGAEENVSVGAGESQSDHSSYSSGSGGGYSYSYSSNGESWALVTDGSQRITFNGDWHNSTRDEVEKARKLSNGKFLWFTHDGKSYFVDDAATIGQIQQMYKPIEELGEKQEALGRQQEELGRQQEALGRKQEEASIPTPDISKEMARLNEAVAKLDAKKGSTVNQEQLADIEGKLGEIQGRLGELQGEVGTKQGELGAQQGELGAKQGELGAQQGRLGEEQGRLSQEADRKVKSIISESLRDGKAKPVQ
ncbi:MAG: M56 family metallopeptidase [Terracidiphilus sp.]